MLWTDLLNSAPLKIVREVGPQSVPTKKMVKAVCEKVRSNPKRFIQKLAKDMIVRNTSTRIVIRNDLQLFPYKMIKRQHFPLFQKHKTLDRANLPLRELKANTAADEIIFLDKKSILQMGVLEGLRSQIQQSESQSVGEVFRWHLRFFENSLSSSKTVSCRDMSLNLKRLEGPL